MKALTLRFLPGAAHSVTSIAVGYPFDTVKTQLQLGLHSSTWNCADGIFKKSGVRGLYRGAAMPLFQLVVKRPFEFAVFESFNAQFKGKPYAPVLGGCLAGITSAIIGCPFSVVKIQMQATGQEIHSGITNAVVAVWRKRGALGFYRGLTASVFKEVPFATVYLGTYGNLREQLPKSLLFHALAGATASMITWTVLLPLDTLKTIIQARVLEENQSQNWTLQLRQFIKTRGFHALWSGLGPVAVRSFPSSAAAMMAYESARSITL